MRRLGGALQRSGDSITIHNGATGVNMAFMAELQATITLKRKSNDEYEIYCDILYKPNGLFWACLVVGFFCLWFLWILNFLYLMVDPLPAYQSILDRIPNKI
mgnify:CR=1 FL=1